MTIPFRSIDYIKTQEALDAYRKATEEEIIERCAQVAEQWTYEKHPTCKSIAAAIRALKTTYGEELRKNPGGCGDFS